MCLGGDRKRPKRCNWLIGANISHRVHGVCVSDSSAYFHQHIDEILLSYGMKRAKSRKICDVIDGYKGSGYGQYTQDDIGSVLAKKCFLKRPSYQLSIVYGIHFHSQIDSRS